MAKRIISIADEKKRDAHVEIESPKTKARMKYINDLKQNVKSQRFVKSTEKNTFRTLAAQYDEGEKLAQALIEGDPEIDFEKTGRLVGNADRVYIREDGSILYCARTLQVKLNPAGEEIDRGDFVDVSATVNEETPLPWTGKLFETGDVIRKFALVRKLRIRHVNGLTFDFLYEMAKKLQDEKKMMLVGSGKRGSAPLIFQTNGSPYRGFLEGRVEGETFLLVLHLSNLELKRVDA